MPRTLPKPVVEPVYAKVDEVAAHLNVSRSTVYVLMDSGELPYAKFGRGRRISWAAVRAYEQRCVVVA